MPMVPRHQPLGGGIQSSDKLRFEVRVQSVGFSVRRILEVGGRLIHMQGRLQGRKGRWWEGGLHYDATEGPEVSDRDCSGFHDADKKKIPTEKRILVRSLGLAVTRPAPSPAMLY